MNTQIQEKGTNFSELKYIIETLFGIDFYKYLTREVVLDEVQEKAVRGVVREYSQGKPLEYILGKGSFLGLDLDMSPSVLIPRPETELLVECVLKYIKVKSRSFILDIGTGCANIPIALSLHHPSAKIVSVDISQAALSLAKANISKHKRDNILLINADGLTCFGRDSFDIIVSNPPYVESSYIDTSSSGHEPRIALDGGDDGLVFIRRILDRARDHLKSEGRLFLEIGYGQAEKVIARAKSRGWTLQEVVQDYSGIDRVIVFKTGTTVRG